MKRLLLYLMLGAALSTSCKKEAPVDTDSQEAAATEYNEPEFQITDINEMENPVTQAPTETQDLSVQLSPENAPEDLCNIEESRNHDWSGNLCRCGKRHEHVKRGLPVILRKLNLTSTQKESVKGFLKDHRQCICEHHKKAHRIMMALRDSINQQRVAVVSAFRSGLITRTQEEGALRQLHQDFKTHLKNNAERNMHIRAIRQCREELIKNIASVLDRKQLTKWKEWVSQHQ